MTRRELVARLVLALSLVATVATSRAYGLLQENAATTRDAPSRFHVTVEVNGLAGSEATSLELEVSATDRSLQPVVTIEPDDLSEQPAALVGGLWTHSLEHCRTSAGCRYGFDVVVAGSGATDIEIVATATRDRDPYEFSDGARVVVTIDE